MKRISNRGWKRFGFYLVALVGCGCGSSTAPTPDAARQPEMAEAVPVATVQIADAVEEEASDATPDDQSLTTDEYIALGMPAPDRPWSGVDMQAAAAVLTKLSESEPEKLPRYGSARSGAILTRISSVENSESYRDQSRPLESRIPDALQLMQSCNSIAKLYLSDLTNRGKGSEELIEIYGSLLHFVVVVLDLVDDFIPTLDQNDSKYAIRMDGFRIMRQGYSQMAVGGVMMLSERDVHSTASLKRLLRSMRDTYGKILPSVPPDARTEILTGLTALREDPAMTDLDPELSVLVDFIAKAEDDAP